jgi:hypothetical protein
MRLPSPSSKSSSALVKPLKSFPTRSLYDLIRKLATIGIMRFYGRNTRLRWAWTMKLLRMKKISFVVDLARRARLVAHLNVLTSPQPLVPSPCGCSSATQTSSPSSEGGCSFAMCEQIANFMAILPSTSAQLCVRFCPMPPKWMREGKE